MGRQKEFLARYGSDHHRDQLLSDRHQDAVVHYDIAIHGNDDHRIKLLQSSDNFEVQHAAKKFYQRTNISKMTNQEIRDHISSLKGK